MEQNALVVVYRKNSGTAQTSVLVMAAKVPNHGKAFEEKS
jgi:hypothetical protein